MKSLLISLSILIASPFISEGALSIPIANRLEGYAQRVADRSESYAALFPEQRVAFLQRAYAAQQILERISSPDIEAEDLKQWLEVVENISYLQSELMGGSLALQMRGDVFAAALDILAQEGIQ